MRPEGACPIAEASSQPSQAGVISAFMRLLVSGVSTPPGAVGSWHIRKRATREDLYFVKNNRVTSKLGLLILSC